ncbi:15699_t:CDS:2 [Entrophospora sp. SA101]|nr:15699_t:CDS:2 [Entrophospora sp. SA101]
MERWAKLTSNSIDKFQIELEKKKNTFDYPDALSDMRICTSSEEQLENAQTLTD